MKIVYLVLAIIGVIIPCIFFFQHFSAEGVSLPVFVAALFANPAASGFTSDLLISSFVFWAAMYQQRKQGKGPNPILFIVLNLCVGLSCALPAYLYVRETKS